MEKIKSENIEETNTNQKVEKKVEKTSTPDITAILAEMQKQIDSLKKDKEEQNEIIKKQNIALENLASNNGSLSSNNEILSILKGLKESNYAPKMVKVIFLDDVAQAMFKLQNGTIVKFVKDGPMDSTYGKIVPVSEENAMLLLNEYPDTFKRGALKFDEEHMYLLEEKGIDTSKINYKAMEEIKKFEELNKDEIIALYNNLKYWQKDILKTHIVNLIKEGKANEDLVDKIKILNRLSKEETFVLRKDNSGYDKVGAYETILQKLKEAGIE